MAITMAQETRFQLVKSIHVLVELRITTCKLGITQFTSQIPRDRRTSRSRQQMNEAEH